MTSNLCLKCGSRFERNTTLVENFVLVKCPGCKVFYLEGDGKRFREADFESHAELLRTLRQRAVQVERSRDVDWQIAQALDASDDDPRWRHGGW
jgi:hypothetical protein